MSGTALTEYNNTRITRNLLSIGKECFVTYFFLFDNFKLSTEDIIEQMKKDGKNFTDKSYRSRISKARSIIKAGKSRDALLNVSNSCVPEYVRDQARQLAKGAT